ncbi:O-antigen ligase family protein [Methylocystis parvus]|nr:O-antigen ligase family protein [Methylocystis parvus]WBK00382.1 O-antigen ligase family protein [Methylocystis parvus OBBP]
MIALPAALDMNAIERPFLIAMLVLMYVSYAGLGRDIFFNKLNDPTVYDPIGAHLQKIRFAACIVAATTVIMTSSFSWAMSKVPVAFAPFAVLAVASTAWAAEPTKIFTDAVVMAAMWIALPILMHRIGLQETVRVSLHIIAWVLIFSFLLAILLPSIGRHSGAEAIQAVHAGRWRGIFAHKNGLGPWAAFGSVLLFTHWRLARASRGFCLLAGGCAVACLIFAQSATSLVMAAFLFAMSIFFYALKRLPAPLVLLATALSLGAFVTFYLAAGDLIFGLLGRDASLTGRDQIWPVAREFFQQAPWLGHGYQSLGGPEFLQYVEMLFSQAIPGPESGLLVLLLDLGIIGFFAFFIPYFYALRNGFEWLGRVNDADRSSIEFMIMVLLATLLQAVTETTPMISGGFDGVISFGSLFALMTLPKSPLGVERSEAGLAKSWIARRDELHKAQAPRTPPAI